MPYHHAPALLGCGALLTSPALSVFPFFACTGCRVGNCHNDDGGIAPVAVTLSSLFHSQVHRSWPRCSCVGESKQTNRETKSKLPLRAVITFTGSLRSFRVLYGVYVRRSRRPGVAENWLS
ncbi:hypothetical protein BS47DRAFT_806649 [Hydnum rufescens UP504]|uniref:Secreted protein n=1 Tax=Hydnum rufescens UP504 TaxID=1448309 RepID=A0A9P6DLQ2_9AGAM|nr:hypothetical protein BS47DRAFT_806649 [Hydnum rufescens UP504]